MRTFTSLAILLLIAAVGADLVTFEVHNNRLNSHGEYQTALAQPRLEQLQKAFGTIVDQCREYGSEEAVERVKVAPQQMMQCVMSTIDVSQVLAEMQPTGDVKVVFKKYCKKTSELLLCANNFRSSIEGCLIEDQKQVIQVLYDLVSMLLNFTCFEDGDRIAQFIAEGGPECLESKETEIKQKCIKKSVRKYTEKLFGSHVDITDISKFKNLIFPNKEQCKDIDDVSKCVVTFLQGCSGSMPANNLEIIFKIIRKALRCKMTQRENTEITEALVGKGSGGSGNALHIILPCVSLALVLLLVLVAKVFCGCRNRRNRGNDFQILIPT